MDADRWAKSVGGGLEVSLRRFLVHPGGMVLRTAEEDPVTSVLLSENTVGFFWYVVVYRLGARRKLVYRFSWGGYCRAAKFSTAPSMNEALCNF